MIEPNYADDDRKDFADGDDERSNMLFELSNDVVHKHLSKKVHDTDPKNVPYDSWVVGEELQYRPDLKCYHTVAKTEPEDPFVDLKHQIERTRLVDRLHLCLKVRE